MTTFLWWYVTVGGVFLSLIAFNRIVMADKTQVGRYIGLVLWLIAYVPFFSLLWLVR